MNATTVRTLVCYASMGVVAISANGQSDNDPCVIYQHHLHDWASSKVAREFSPAGTNALIAQDIGAIFDLEEDWHTLVVVLDNDFDLLITDLQNQMAYDLRSGESFFGSLGVNAVHGTPVAGIIAAEKNLFEGQGLAWGAKLVLGSVFEPLPTSDSALT